MIVHRTYLFELCYFLLMGLVAHSTSQEQPEFRVETAQLDPAKFTIADGDEAETMRRELEYIVSEQERCTPTPARISIGCG